MFFDTHAHLNFKDYDKDREEVIKKSLKEGVFMINIGTDVKESKKVMEIADKHKEGVYAAVGLHPLYINKESFHFSFAKYKKMIKHKKVVAVGETGLDYKYIKDNEKEKTRQKDVFKKHIELSQKNNLPLVLHCRMAHQDMINILKKHKAQTAQNTNKAPRRTTSSLRGRQNTPKDNKFPTGQANSKIRGVIHCFTGKEKELKEYLEIGFYIGLNGIIFKMDLEREIKEMPLDRILLETDCPFLTPSPKKGRNEPLFVKHIAEEVARIKKVDVEEVARTTTKNAKELFEV